MKLISKYRDYYDYNIGLYGIDEKVVYNRLPFPDKYYHHIAFDELPHKIPTIYRFDTAEWEYKHLLFCGRVIYIRRKYAEYKANYEVISENKLNEAFQESGRNRYYFRRIELPDYSKKYDAVIDIHRLTKQPVLLLDSWDFKQIMLDTNIPILNDIKGFGSLIDAKSCYLEICQTLIDINNTESIPVSTDGDKILSHGFDKKISFRHRK